MYRGGVQNQAEKIRKNAFWPVPVQKFTFPAMTIGDDFISSLRLADAPAMGQLVL